MQLSNSNALSFKSAIRSTARVVKKIFRNPNIGNTNTNKWNNEKINSAQYVTRPMQNGMENHFVQHHGVLLKTDEGSSYLLHNTPVTGTVITDAKFMSNKWNVDHDIPVVGDKRVGEAMGFTHNGICGYVIGGTCIGAARQAEEYIKND